MPFAHIVRNRYCLGAIQIHEHERLRDLQMFDAIFGAAVIHIDRRVSQFADTQFEAQRITHAQRFDEITVYG